MESKYYKVNEVATLFKVSTRTVYNWIDAGYLRAVRVGDGKKGTIRIPESAIKEFLHKYQTVYTDT